MRWLSSMAFHVKSLFLKRKLDEQLSEEIRTHVDMATEANVAAGMTPEEARYGALREFGNVIQVQELAHDERGWIGLEQVWQDLRYAGRQLVRAPGFTLVVVLTLALGIGATTAIFSVVNVVILNPVGGHDAEQMVQIAQREIVQGKETLPGLSPPVLEALLERKDLFANLAWSEWAQLERKTEDFSQIEYGCFVSPNFFATLRIQPLLGRTFLPDEAVPRTFPQSEPTEDGSLVMSYSWWQTEWGGDPRILGRVIEMSGHHFTVVGVMPRHVLFPNAAVKYWVPAKRVVLPPHSSGAAVSKVIARLAPGVTREQAQTAGEILAQQLLAAHDMKDLYGRAWRSNNPQGLTIQLQPLAVAFQDGNWAQLRQSLFGLFAAISFVLVIVCANVAGLALARTERRQHELAIRAANGASAGRIARQLLTENLLLAVLGGAAGLAVAVWGVDVLMALSTMPRLRPIEMDGRLLAITAAVSILTCLLFSLVPLWRGSRLPVREILADGGMNSTGGRSRSHFRNALIIGQVAVTVVLLTGAGLMLRSVSQMLEADPGFDPQNLLLIDAPLPYKYNSSEAGIAAKGVLVEQIRERLIALPGVKAVGYQQQFGGLKYQADGETAERYALNIQTGLGAGDWVRALRTPLSAGRLFTIEDAAQKELVVINETMAQQAWPGESAVGQRFHRVGGPGSNVPEIYEVVGVVADARMSGYTRGVEPLIYHPFQAPWTKMHIWGYVPVKYVIRTEGDPAGLIPLVRRELLAAEPTMFMPGFRTAREMLFNATWMQRTYRNYLMTFAGLGLLLSALGIYGVLAYSVARRTREIGIRMAVGAETRQVWSMIMWQGTRLIGAGIVLGLAASAALTRLLQSQLFRVTPTDPLVATLAVIVLAAVALVACWLPARRAAKVDPMIALRSE